jgi:hypothetical protein
VQGTGRRVQEATEPDGHIRIRLKVAADGTPSMEFLDAMGKITHQWPESPAK